VEIELAGKASGKYVFYVVFMLFLFFYKEKSWRLIEIHAKILRF